MAEPPKIAVLCGGVGAEREVSRASGAAIGRALAASFRVDLVELHEAAVPAEIDPAEAVVFPALHGTYGEDGGVQAELESRGIAYAGSDAAASRLCMDKGATKERAAALDIPVPEGLVFEASAVPGADAIRAELGDEVVVKPVDQGSSVGLHFASHRSELGAILSGIREGRWLAERRIRGRELTVGILKGAAMGIVEIKSASGVYDYAAKYTAGTTVYEYPAEVETAVEARLKDHAEQLFDACGCRDFARIDFLLEGRRAYFLEINTLPGLTATSLLPKSADCVGFDFEALAAQLVEPAISRFRAGGGKGDPK